MCHSRQHIFTRGRAPPSGIIVRKITKSTCFVLKFNCDSPFRLQQTADSTFAMFYDTQGYIQPNCVGFASESAQTELENGRIPNSEIEEVFFEPGLRAHRCHYGKCGTCRSKYSALAYSNRRKQDTGRYVQGRKCHFWVGKEKTKKWKVSAFT